MNIYITKIICLLLIVLTLTSCSNAVDQTAIISPTPTSSFTPTITQISKYTPQVTLKSTSTPIPQVIVMSNTHLYEGPGNYGYQVIADLDKGTILVPEAEYGDFLKVNAVFPDGEKEGFVWKDTLQGDYENVRQIDEDEVPWILYSDLLNEFVFHNSHVEDSAFIVDNLHNDDWEGYDEGWYILDGPLKLKINIGDSSGRQSSVRISGRLKNPGGDWWEGIHWFVIAKYQGQYQIEIHDGTSENSIKRIKIPNSITESFSIEILDNLGKKIIVRDDEENTVLTIDVPSLDVVSLPNGIFPDGRVYFGVLIGPESKLVASKLEVYKLPSGDYVESDEFIDSLKRNAELIELDIGAHISYWDLRNIQLRDIFETEYNRQVMESFHWLYIRPSRDEFDFSITDKAVEYALDKGMTIEGHHLVWGEKDHLPDWLLQGNFTRDELIDILHDHISTVAGRYKGKVKVWSIANEAPSRGLWGLDFWRNRIGADYIDMVFKWAREADPDAILMLNDNNNESARDKYSSQSVYAMYNQVEKMKKKNTPIDAIGLQMHLLSPFSSPYPPRKDKVIETMNKYCELGVEIYITEFDINLADYPGSKDEKYAFQADLYRDMLEACIEVEACKAFSTFGISDKYSWYREGCLGCLGIPNAAPLPFDEKLQPKPAYYSMLETIKKTH